MTTTIEPTQVETNTFYWAITESGPRRHDSADEVMVIRRTTTSNWLALIPEADVGSLGQDRDLGWKLKDSLVGELPAKAMEFADTHRGWWIHEDQVKILRPYETKIEDFEDLLDDEPESEDEAPEMVSRETVAELERRLAQVQTQMAELEGHLRAANLRADENQQELERFKLRVTSVGQEAAERHDWCSTYDEIMERLGLPGRERTYTVAVRCHFTADVSVTARSDEEAEEQIRELGTASMWNPAGSFVSGAQMSRPYSMEYEIDE